MKKIKKDNKVENYIKSENNNIDDSNKNRFYNSLKSINYRLDFTRNTLFNLILSNSYVNIINFEYDKELKNIANYINSIELDIENILKKLNLKFENERRNN